MHIHSHIVISCVFGSVRRGSTVVALTPSVFLCLNAANFNHFLSIAPEFKPYFNELASHSTSTSSPVSSPSLHSHPVAATTSNGAAVQSSVLHFDSIGELYRHAAELGTNELVSVRITPALHSGDGDNDDHSVSVTIEPAVVQPDDELKSNLNRRSSSALTGALALLSAAAGGADGNGGASSAPTASTTPAPADDSTGAEFHVLNSDKATILIDSQAIDPEGIDVAVAAPASAGTASSSGDSSPSLDARSASPSPSPLPSDSSSFSSLSSPSAASLEQQLGALSSALSGQQLLVSVILSWNDVLQQQEQADEVEDIVYVSLICPTYAA
jgi:hypothetical protein